MNDKIEELQPYLCGLNTNMPVEFQKLAEIFEYGVFELCQGDEPENQEDYLIPYMMNDAVEDYLILKNCRLVGKYLTEKELTSNKSEEPLITAEIVEKPDGYILIVHQGAGNVFTLHFENIEERVKYYQYHQIGHFWVKGQEQWRQLVYIIGTMYDKYEYMGNQACNEKELELLNLITFPPFRAWSPINESLAKKYPASAQGAETMRALALQAGDRSFARWIGLYRRMPLPFLENVLSNKLLSPKRESLYRLICDKVKEASCQYPQRDYGTERNEEIRQKRENIHYVLAAKGYQGTYPEYYRRNTYVLVTEEHPFTLMEFDDFVFHVQFMVSECGKNGKTEKNCGFFKGKDRKGYILPERRIDKIP